MKHHRFFVSEKLIEGREVLVQNLELARQLKNVLRLALGDQVTLLDNSGFEFQSEIMTLAKDGIRVRVGVSSPVPYVPRNNVHLFPSLIKKDKLEWVLEKGTELGVQHFTLLVGERSEKKNFNHERGEKIIKEAAEQSGKGTLPILDPVTRLQDVIDHYSHISLCAFHLEGEKFSGHDRVQEHIGVCVGPEGGWTKEEIKFFKEKKIPIYSLGQQVLRAETASIAIASLLLL